MDCKTGPSRKQFIFIIIACMIAALIIGVIIGYFSKNSTHSAQSKQQNVLVQKKLRLPKETHHTKQTLDTKMHTQRINVLKGDTMSALFHRAGLSQQQLINILKLKQAYQVLRNIKPGQIIVIIKNNHQQFYQLTAPINEAESLVVTKSKGKLSTKIIKQHETKIVQFKSGIIHHSLASAALKTGLTPNLLHELETMFQGKINFSRDIKPGDRFNILYNEYYIDGQKNHPGHIIAASMDVNHTHYKVIRFTKHDHHGYYTPNGHSIKSLFLKFPIIFERISSGFSYHRMDPILHKICPHLGIDLAAPIGTPIKAIGNGHVILRRWVRGYGNTVMIQYNKTYKTLYGHLEKFAAHLHDGEHVKKGQIVGYVGDTGWSTGPHLHFEIYKNGKPVNPLTLHFPHSRPIPKKYFDAFTAKYHQLLTEMHMFEKAKT